MSLTCTALSLACAAHTHVNISSRIHSQSVGKYILSPLVKRTDNGQYAASISVRSGRGSGTHDRIYRFVPSFPTSEDALRYALAQGRSFIARST